MAPKLNVVICSTRPGRVGPAVGAWVHDQAAAHGGFETELVDLADFQLPVFDEPNHPRRDYQHEHTRAWSRSVASADAFVFVSPEYNYFPPPSFVNAIDFLFHEWNYKAAGLVTYGGPLAGARAAQQAKLLTSVRVMTVPEGVSVPSVTSRLDDQKRFKAPEFLEPSMTAMLDELAKWAGVLKGLRSP